MSTLDENKEEDVLLSDDGDSRPNTAGSSLSPEELAAKRARKLERAAKRAAKAERKALRASGGGGGDGGGDGDSRPGTAASDRPGTASSLPLVVDEETSDGGDGSRPGTAESTGSSSLLSPEELAAKKARKAERAAKRAAKAEKKAMKEAAAAAAVSGDSPVSPTNATPGHRPKPSLTEIPIPEETEEQEQDPYAEPELTEEELRQLNDQKSTPSSDPSKPSNLFKKQLSSVRSTSPPPTSTTPPTPTAVATAAATPTVITTKPAATPSSTVSQSTPAPVVAASTPSQPPTTLEIRRPSAIEVDSQSKAAAESPIPIQPTPPVTATTITQAVPPSQQVATSKPQASAAAPTLSSTPAAVSSSPTPVQTTPAPVAVQQTTPTPSVSQPSSSQAVSPPPTQSATPAVQAPSPIAVPAPKTPPTPAPAATQSDPQPNHGSFHTPAKPPSVIIPPDSSPLAEPIGSPANFAFLSPVHKKGNGSVTDSPSSGSFALPPPASSGGKASGSPSLGAMKKQIPSMTPEEKAEHDKKQKEVDAHTKLLTLSTHALDFSVQVKRVKAARLQPQETINEDEELSQSHFGRDSPTTMDSDGGRGGSPSPKRGALQRKLSRSPSLRSVKEPSAVASLPLVKTFTIHNESPADLCILLVPESMCFQIQTPQPMYIKYHETVDISIALVDLPITAPFEAMTYQLKIRAKRCTPGQMSSYEPVAFWNATKRRPYGKKFLRLDYNPSEKSLDSRTKAKDLEKRREVVLQAVHKDEQLSQELQVEERLRREQEMRKARHVLELETLLKAEQDKMKRDQEARAQKERMDQATKIWLEKEAKERERVLRQRKAQLLSKRGGSADQSLPLSPAGERLRSASRVIEDDAVAKLNREVAAAAASAARDDAIDPQLLIDRNRSFAELYPEAFKQLSQTSNKNTPLWGLAAMVNPRIKLDYEEDIANGPSLNKPSGRPISPSRNLLASLPLTPWNYGAVGGHKIPARPPPVVPGQSPERSAPSVEGGEEESSAPVESGSELEAFARSKRNRPGRTSSSSQFTNLTVAAVTEEKQDSQSPPTTTVVNKPSALAKVSKFRPTVAVINPNSRLLQPKTSSNKLKPVGDPTNVTGINWNEVAFVQSKNVRGYMDAFFHFLSTLQSSASDLPALDHVLIPDTVLFRDGSAVAYYYSGSSGDVREKSWSKISPTKALLRFEPVQIHGKTEHQGYKDSIVGTLLVAPPADNGSKLPEYLPFEDVSVMLAESQNVLSGNLILQQFVRPTGANHEQYKAVWSTGGQFQLRKRVHHRAYTDVSVVPAERLVNFDSPVSELMTEDEITSGPLHRKFLRIIETIAAHLSSQAASHQLRPIKISILFQRGPHESWYILYCDQINYASIFGADHSSGLDAESHIPLPTHSPLSPYSQPVSSIRSPTSSSGGGRFTREKSPLRSPTKRGGSTSGELAPIVGHGGKKTSSNGSSSVADARAALVESPHACVKCHDPARETISLLTVLQRWTPNIFYVEPNDLLEVLSAGKRREEAWLQRKQVFVCDTCLTEIQSKANSMRVQDGPTEVINTTYTVPAPLQNSKSSPLLFVANNYATKV